MAFIASYWFVWLAGMGVFGALAFNNQIKRMKGVVSGDAFADPGKAFFSGVGMMAIFALLACGSGIMLAISVIVNLIGYASA